MRLKPATLLTAAFLALGASLPLAAPSAPQPAPGSADGHIFYGAIRPGAGNAPVLVFVHGLAGMAADWWVDNDMYLRAYGARYRTAFVDLSPDNSRNYAAISPNADVLRDALPKIAAHYGVPQVYVIGHSKGGVDLQAALLDPGVTRLAKAVFTIATPHGGTELADWAFGPGRPLAERLDRRMPGLLLSPGLFALKTDSMDVFRRRADPYFEAAGVPFYTIAGDTALGNPLLAVTGGILGRLTGGTQNDGLVPVERTGLANTYAADLGNVAAHHFKTRLGSVAFWKIRAEIEGLERAHDFQKVASAGLGDPQNSWPWFLKWFKGKLYLGTGRAVNCVSFATAFVRGGLPVYPPRIGDCPADFRDLPLAAEIWRYTPETRVWERVFKSPEDVPIGGNPPKSTARDIGFRGAMIVEEPGGVEALYVAGVSASSLFEDLPRWAGNPQGYPPPRILRSVDGVDWQPLPQRPGTFLGDVSKNSGSLIRVRGFRSLEVFGGQLYATMSDYRGVGVVIASPRPWEGNDSWRQVSPRAEIFPVWALKAFNGFLYAGTGDRRVNDGYGVWKTDGVGPVPVWQPVITDGGWQSIPTLRSPNVLNMLEFEGRLYVGTDRPTELVRVNPDDSWDLLVGARRMTPDGLKKPLSTIINSFGNTFNGHFWNMGAYDGALYLGTWDWSVLLNGFGAIAEPFRSQFGFDLFRTEDGENWTIVSNKGFGHPWNYGVRSLEPTPFGFFIGAAKPQYGLEVWLDNHALDHDDDGDIDQADVDEVIDSIGDPNVGPDDPRDMDRDGQIATADARLLATQCTLRGCRESTGTPRVLTEPELRSVSRDVIGPKVALYWPRVPGAIQYRVYKQPVQRLLDFVPDNLTITLPGLGTLTIEDILNGALDFLCRGGGGSDLCAVIDVLGSIASNESIGLPAMARPVALTRDTCFQEDPLGGEPPGSGAVLQSIYFVRAEDASGNVSAFSNIVGGPSEGYPRPRELAPPSITPIVNPPANVHGWNNTPVRVAWRVTNAGSRTDCRPARLAAEPAGIDLACSAASLTCIPDSRTVTVRIDRTPPSVSFGSPSPSANPAGWHNADVAIPFDVLDDLSGPAGASATSPLVVSAEGAAVTERVSAADRAGNTVAVASPPLRIDRTPPSIVARLSPPPDAHGRNHSEVSVAFECTDALSGVSSCGPSPQLVVTPGTHAVTAEAFDHAGNRAELTVTVNILLEGPQVCVQFDRSRLDVVVVPCDDPSGGYGSPLTPSSTHPVSWDGGGAPDAQRRRFELMNRSGDVLDLEVDVFRGANEVWGRVATVAYNGTAQGVIGNRMHFGWRGGPPKGPGRINQELRADVQPFRIKAEYYRQRDESTVVWQWPGPQRGREEVFTGLVLLQTSVDPGGLRHGHTFAGTPLGAPSPVVPRPPTPPKANPRPAEPEPVGGPASETSVPDPPVVTRSATSPSVPSLSGASASGARAPAPAAPAPPAPAPPAPAPPAAAPPVAEASAPEASAPVSSVSGASVSGASVHQMSVSGASAAAAAQPGALPGPGPVLSTTFDLTDPGVFVQFDPASLDIVVVASDPASGAPGQPLPPSSTHPAWRDESGSGGPPDGQRRRFEVSDRAGNTLELEVTIFHGASELWSRVVSLTYNGTAQHVPENRMHVGWRIARPDRGPGRIDQQLVADTPPSEPFRIKANYYRQRNESTVVREWPGPQRKKEQVFPGLVHLRTSVGRGRLRLEYTP